MTTDAHAMGIHELKAFLVSSDVLTFKGLIRSYMQKITGMSVSQLTRLIGKFRRTSHVRVCPYRWHCLPTKYTREDQLLLAEVDDAHERISGKSTAAIFKREYELFSKEEFKRLSNISVAHLYRLRQSSFYRNHTLSPSRRPGDPTVSIQNGAVPTPRVNPVTCEWTPSIKGIGMARKGSIT